MDTELEELKFFAIQSHIPMEVEMSRVILSYEQYVFFDMLAKLIEKTKPLMYLDSDVAFFISYNKFGAIAYTNRGRQYSFVSTSMPSRDDNFYYFYVLAPAETLVRYFRVLAKALKNKAGAVIRIGKFEDRFAIETTIYKDLSLTDEYVITTLMLNFIDDVNLVKILPNEIVDYLERIKFYIGSGYGSGFWIYSWINKEAYKILKSIKKPEIRTEVEWNSIDRSVKMILGSDILYLTSDYYYDMKIAGQEKIVLDSAPVLFPDSGRTTYETMSLYGFATDEPNMAGFFAEMINRYIVWVSAHFGRREFAPLG